MTKITNSFLWKYKLFSEVWKSKNVILPIFWSPIKQTSRDGDEIFNIFINMWEDKEYKVLSKSEEEGDKFDFSLMIWYEMTWDLKIGTKEKN